MLTILLTTCTACASSPYTQTEKFSSHQKALQQRIPPQHTPQSVTEAQRQVEEARQELNRSQLERIAPNTSIYQDPARQQRLDQEYFQNLREYRDSKTDLYWERVKERYERRNP